MSDISTSNAENRGLLASGSNLIALISFLISIVGFFVPLIVAFGLLGRGTSATSAAIGSSERPQHRDAGANAVAIGPGRGVAEQDSSYPGPGTWSGPCPC